MPCLVCVSATHISFLISFPLICMENKNKNENNRDSESTGSRSGQQGQQGQADSQGSDSSGRNMRSDDDKSR